MKQTKKLTLSAAAVAFGVVFMLLGSFFEVMELTVAVFASLLVVFIYIEIGSPYTWLVWLATATLTAVFNFANTMWLVYLVIFGVYPILKGYIERLPRLFWWLLKLVYINLALALAVLGSQLLIGLPFFGDVSDIFGLPPMAVYIILWVLMNVAFVLYDIMINVMIRFYMQRLRPKFRKLLK